MKIIAIVFLMAASLTGYQLLEPEVKLHYALQTKPVWDNPKHPSVVMLGDSQTLVPNWNKLMDCQHIANFGVGGETSAKILLRIQSAIDQAPRLIVIMAGTNDAVERLPAETTISNIEQMKQALLARRINYVIVAPPPFPANQDDIDKISDAATLRVPFTQNDLLSDKTRLRRSGYAKWRDTIAPIIEKYC